MQHSGKKRTGPVDAPAEPSSCPCRGPSGPETRPATRRSFLAKAGAGFGLIALSSMLAEEGLLAESAAAGNANAAPPPLGPHFAARAKQVIFLFMSGGPSHLETFDPKPDLQRLHGQRLPDSFGTVKTRRAVERNKLLATRRTFCKHGQGGIDISDLFPKLAECADDLCVLRGCHGDSVTHPESVYLMNTGSILMGRPSLGSWAAYGLGTANRDLPSYVVLPDPGGWVKGGAPAWGSGFLPARHQGTLLRGGASPILHLQPPAGVAPDGQRRALDLIARLNAEHARRREVIAGASLEARLGDGGELAARIEAYELAFRMQSHAPEAVDVSRETPATRRLYGLDEKSTTEFGLRCLLARRCIERGVRFVQVYCGDTNGWDGHSDIEENHTRLAAQSDVPVAGLLRDLKSRGLLESTLVIWGGEFGRTPMTEGTNGRDHNPHGFSIWLAGGGVKGGQQIGTTDAVGLRAESETAHVHDLHATILHLLGLNHRKLTFRRDGRDERLTDTAGEVIRKVLA